MLTDTIPTAPIQEAVDRINNKEEKSKNIIKKYTLISSGAALVPYDFVDVVTATVTQTMMIKELCSLHNVPFSEKKMNVAFWSATGSVIIKAITEAVGSVINRSSLDATFDLTGAAVAGIYTAAVGEFYNLHFQDGGTLEDVEMTDFVNYFMDEIKRGDLSIATFTNPKALLSHLNIV